MSLRDSTAPIRLWPLAVLLLMDGLLVTVDLMNRLLDWDNPLLDIQNDTGAAELFQASKLVICLLSIFLLMVRDKENRFMKNCWVVIFALLLVDDSMMIHESLGAALANAMFVDSSQGQALGELLVLMLYAIIILLLVMCAFIASDRLGERFTLSLLVLLLLMGVFAVAVDFVHSTVEHPELHLLVGYIEEGGELITWSFVCWYMLLTWYRFPPPSIPQLIRTSAFRWHLVSVGDKEKDGGV